jgi:hypothetical protein
MTETEKALRVALLKVELLERGIHPIAVRGILADDAVIQRLTVDEPALEISAFASEVARDVPRSMLRDAESPEDWAGRRFGDEGAGALPDYAKRTYRLPSAARSAAKS